MSNVFNGGWHALTHRCKQYAEYWAAIGTYLLNQRKFSQRRFGLLPSRLNRDPTDIASMRRINQSLTALGAVGSG